MFDRIFTDSMDIQCYNEHHKMKIQRGNMWVKWFDFTLFKSMDKDMVEELNTKHATKRWLWPSMRKVYWKGVYERERHH